MNFSEVRRALLSQIHSPHLRFGAPGIFSDLLRSVQMLKERVGCEKATGSYRTYSPLVKLQPWFLSLRWTICLWAELPPWCLSLQWKTCPWAEHTYTYIHKYIWRRRVIGISGSLIWSKTLWNWYLTPVVNFGEVRRAQLVRSPLLTTMLGPLGSFQII